MIAGSRPWPARPAGRAAGRRRHRQLPRFVAAVDIELQAGVLRTAGRRAAGRRRRRTSRSRWSRSERPRAFCSLSRAPFAAVAMPRSDRRVRPQPAAIRQPRAASLGDRAAAARSSDRATTTPATPMLTEEHADRRPTVRRCSSASARFRRLAGVEARAGLLFSARVGRRGRFQFRAGRCCESICRRRLRERAPDTMAEETCRRTSSAVGRSITSWRAARSCRSSPAAAATCASCTKTTPTCSDGQRVPRAAAE